MYEYVWLHGNDLGEMLRVVDEMDSRRLALTACGCVRRVWAVITDSRLKAAVETAEDFADFRVKKQQVKAISASLLRLVDETRERVLRDKAAVPDWVWGDPEQADWWAQFGTVGWVERQVQMIQFVLRPSRVDVGTLTTVVDIARQLSQSYRVRSQAEDLKGQCDLLRDIFGNPFQPVTLHPSWRTETVHLMARGMYESRDFSAMPILADALQDAGCDNDAVLQHCRQPGEHVRGCWVVDAVLGKK